MGAQRSHQNILAVLNALLARHAPGLVLIFLSAGREAVPEQRGSQLVPAIALLQGPTPRPVYYQPPGHAVRPDACQRRLAADL